MLRFGLFRFCKNINSARLTRLFSSHHDSPAWLPISDKPTVNAHFDDVYSPEGDWNEHVKQLNSRYNVYLAAAFAFFLVSLTTYVKLGCFQFHILNYPKFENTPEGLAFYEYGRKHYTELSDEYAALNNPKLKEASEKDQDAEDVE